MNDGVPGRLAVLAVLLEVDPEQLAGRLPDSLIEPLDMAGTITDNVLRREFLAVVVSLGVSLVDPERFAAVFDGHLPTDRELLDDLQQLLRRYAGQYDQMAPGLLHQRSRAALEAIKLMLAGPLGPGLRRDVLALGAEAGVLAGWASRTAGRLDEARATYTIANALARAADADHLRAFIRTRVADLHSMVQSGGAPVQQPERTRPLLDAAEDMAGPAAPPALRAHVLLRQSEEHAAAGETVEAARYLDRADAAFSVAVDDGDGLYGIRWDMRIHDAYRGNVAVLSGDLDDALVILDATLQAMPAGTVSNRSSVLADLAATQARRGDIDAACALLGESFTIARAAGLDHRTQRALGIRQRDLGQWERERVVRELDEALR